MEIKKKIKIEIKKPWPGAPSDSTAFTGLASLGCSLILQASPDEATVYRNKQSRSLPRGGVVGRCIGEAGSGGRKEILPSRAMNDNTQKLNTVFAVILIAASGFLVTVGGFNKLDSPRPSQVSSDPFPTVGSQTVAARLWQDPFEALKTLTNSPAKAASQVATNFASDSGNGVGRGAIPQGPLLQSLAAKTSTRDGAVAILGVMLEGTPYPEDAEVRRRLRYAVEVALLTSGLSPEDRSHIGADTLALTQTNASGASNVQRAFLTANLNVAFEWFTRTATNGPQSVLLLWLKEDDFANFPLQTIGEVMKALAVTQPNTTHFYLIGPRSSNTLKGIAEDPAEGFAAAGLADHFHILSPEATAPDWALFPEERAQIANFDGRDWMIAQKFGPAAGRGSFSSWIATEDASCRNLVAELANRRVGPELRAGDRIVLISEGDTFYGRLLPTVFERALTNQIACGSSAAGNLWRFNYLRGLEGIKPQSDKEKEKKASVASTPEALVRAALENSGERAEGEAQNDYARRLAEFLSRADAQLRSTNGGIRAIGLMGNDVYDKLLLLQALRSKLPAALFFTTDLDARLWMPPDQLDFTRNLLVASAYPLEPQLPGERFLPFRDLYQTAVFTACRAAVVQIGGGRPADPDLRGRVYEIGRHGPVPLDLLEASKGKVPGAGSRAETKPWLPGYLRYAAATLIATLGPLLLITILLGGFRNSNKRDRRVERVENPQADVPPRALANDFRLRWQAFVWVALLIILFLMVAWVASWVADQTGEEPWRFSDGVSIWPTEGLRFLALALSNIFVVLAAHRHDRHLRRLWCDYFSTGGEARLPRPFPFPAAFWRLLRRRLEASAARIKSQPGEAGKVSPAPESPTHPLLRRLKAWLDRFEESQPTRPGLHINNWRVPITERDRVDASQLFLDFNQTGRRLFRHVRTWIMVLSYLLLAAGFVFLTGDIPERPCVRGPGSFQFDSWLLGLSVLGFLLVLFYTLDAARLAARMLEAIARPTAWPRWLLRKWAREKSVREQDLDGWLDVQFAVEKTRETGRLLIYPFLIFLLLLIARNNYFENWYWPNSLIIIFAFNFLLAAACWWFVRQSARTVKRQAIAALKNTISHVKNAAVDKIITPGLTTDEQGEQREISCTYTTEAYAKRLGELCQEVEDERRAAFAPWLQDPTYLALFIPTGVTGLITILLGYLLNRR